MEASAPAGVEATLKYHPARAGTLTHAPDRGGGPRQVGSLTGAVASQKVTEAPKGSLRVDGNHPQSVLARRELDCKGDTPRRAERRAK